MKYLKIKAMGVEYNIQNPDELKELYERFLNTGQLQEFISNIETGREVTLKYIIDNSERIFIDLADNRTYTANDFELKVLGGAYD